ncbi:hypothetical protein DVH24_031970 [Malus domestica]|uniref:Uncharacterized protein n=1 Tax=Malus domestica TaxID=3750 RepID=A0A498J737_MALDO|nr:hypothetical protein DVH24_031970 [Malus domestica]
MDVESLARSTRKDSGLHKCIFFLLTMLGVLLQVKCAALQASPFDTNYVIFLILIADLFVYAGTLAIVKILQASHNSDMYELMNKISLLCGTFSLILLTFLLVPDFGWFALACWAICFVTTMVKSYPTLKRLCTSTTNATDMLCYIIRNLKELNMRLNGIEESQSQNQNGIYLCYGYVASRDPLYRLFGRTWIVCPPISVLSPCPLVLCGHG